MANVTGTGAGDGNPLGDVYDPLAWLKDATGDKNNKNNNPNLPGDNKDNPPADNPPGGDGDGRGGGYSSGGGGGGGGGGGNTGQKYIEDYQLKFFANGKPPDALLQKAIKNNWSIAKWEQQVRLTDPSYYKSLEAKTILPQFNKTMKILFPGLADRTKQAALMKSPFYKRIALWYLKNGIGKLGNAGTEILYSKITNTKRWNQNNPAYKAYARNRDASVQAEMNPLVFKQLEQGMKMAFQEAAPALQLDDSYYKEFFKSRYASSSGIKDLATNLSTIAATSSSYAWFNGEPMDKGTVKTAAFNAGQQGSDLRTRMNQAFGVRKSFLSSDQQGFGTQISDQGKLVKPTL